MNFKRLSNSDSLSLTLPRTIQAWEQCLLLKAGGGMHSYIPPQNRRGATRISFEEVGMGSET